MINSYLVFHLTGLLFGVKLLGAIEILPWRSSRPVPLSYIHVEGLIDYRGTIYPVFNLSQRLGLGRQEPIGFIASEKRQPTVAQSIILLEERNMHFGIIVDGVARMAMLEEAVTAPEKVSNIDARFVKGVIFEDDQEIMILDFERLFNAS